MELQWPLILFTCFVAWSAGLFGAQALLAARGKGKKAQKPAWICSAVLLVIGVIAVFFHLEHWERIFNGFGHLSSGITQELIAVVVLVIVAIAYFAMMRKSEDGASVPKWFAWVAVVVCVLLVGIMASSYLMAARPAWNSVLWVVYVLGNACVLGPTSMMFIMSLVGDSCAEAARTVLFGALIAFVAALGFALTIQLSGGSFMQVEFYYDPTHPTKDMIDPASILSAQAVLLWLGAVVLGGFGPVVCALVGLKKDEQKAWKALAIIALILAIIGALCMRVVFYNVGLSVFMFY